MNRVLSINVGTTASAFQMSLAPTRPPATIEAAVSRA